MQNTFNYYLFLVYIINLCVYFNTPFYSSVIQHCTAAVLAANLMLSSRHCRCYH